MGSDRWLLAEEGMVPGEDLGDGWRNAVNLLTYRC